MPFPEVWLQGTPFHSYFFPGLILCLVVGGSQLVATFILLWHDSVARMASLIAGLLLTGWMAGELTLIGFQAPIQVFFVTIGLLEVGCPSQKCAVPRGGAVRNTACFSQVQRNRRRAEFCRTH